MARKSESEKRAGLAVSREDLYQLAWSQPMTKLADRFGVSSGYLARICSRLNVPTPERGHWAKLAAGKKVYEPPLPEAQPTDELEWARESDCPSEWKVILPVPPAKLRAKPRAQSFRQDQHHLTRNAGPLFFKGPTTENGDLKLHKKRLVDILVSE